MKTKRIQVCLLAMGLAFACVLAIYFGNDIHPFGDKTVVTGDLAGLYMPFYANVYQGGHASYSFSKGLGGGLQGLSAYVPFSPYMLILYMIPASGLGVFFTVLLAVKLIAAAGAMTFYLCGKSKPSLAAALLGLCYAFMSYNLIYAQNTMWLDNVVLLPLLLFALDRMLDTGRTALFCGLLALSILTNYYTAFMMCIFLILYFLWETAGNRGWSLKTIAQKSARFAGSGVLAVAVSAAILIPTVVHTLQAKTLGEAAGNMTNFSWRDFWRQALFMGFTWDQLEFGLPIIYCGLLCLTGVVFYFMSNKIARRQKIASGVFLAGLLLSFWLAPLNRMWHIFRDPVWFPYRFSFVFAALLLTLAATALVHPIPEKKRLWMAGGGVAAVLFVIAATQYGVLSTKKIVITCAIAVALFAAVILKNKFKKPILRTLAVAGLIVCVVAEMTINGVYITSLFELRGNTQTNAYIQAISELSAIAQADEFTRVEKDDYFSLNDPMLMGYNGLNHFSSIADANSEQMLAALGYGGVYKNGTFALVPANALLGMRYIISDSPYAALHGYTEIDARDTYTLYEANAALPFAFYCEYSGDVEFASNPFETITQIYTEILGRETRLFSRSDVAEQGTGWQVNARQPGYYYAYFLPKTDGSNLVMDGKDFGVARLFDGNKGIVPLGYHDEPFSFALASNDLVVYCMDAQVFADSVAEVNAAAPQVVQVRDGAMDIQAQQAGLIILAMPYYEDWIVEINGQPATLQQKLGCFAAVEVEENDAIITLRYRPRGQTAGIWISAASVAAFGVIVAYEKGLFSDVRKKRKAGKMKPA